MCLIQSFKIHLAAYQITSITQNQSWSHGPGLTKVDIGALKKAYFQTASEAGTVWNLIHRSTVLSFKLSIGLKFQTLQPVFPNMIFDKNICLCQPRTTA